MEINSVNNLSGKILDRLKEKKEVRDEQISLFLEWTLNAIEKPELFELPNNFHLLKEKVLKCRIYDKVDELEAMQAFVYGNLWSAIKLIELAEKRKEYEISIDLLAKRNLKNYKIFRIIEKSPGIKHKDLAEQSGKTPSELSQYFSQIGDDRFVSFVRLGREKYYYLEERGVCLLGKMNVLRELNCRNIELTDDKVTSLDMNESPVKSVDKISVGVSLDNNNILGDVYFVDYKGRLNNIVTDFRRDTKYKEREENYKDTEHHFIKERKPRQIFEEKVKTESFKLNLLYNDEDIFTKQLSPKIPEYVTKNFENPLKCEYRHF